MASVMGHPVLLRLSEFVFTIHAGWILGGSRLFGHNQFTTSQAFFNIFSRLGFSKCHLDNTPYLEVHHKKKLSDGGEDTMKNVMALCAELSS